MNKLFFALCLCFVMVMQIALANDSVFTNDEEQQLNELLSPKPGARACPLRLEILTTVTGFGEKCPESGEFIYYECCGENNAVCCAHPQPILIVLLAVLATVLLICLLIALFCGLLNCLIECLCCCFLRNSPRRTRAPGYARSYGNY